MDEIEISVVMATYNAGEWLRESIESVLAQTFGGFEFIIVNDGSTDGSGEVIREYGRRDPRIRVIEQANTGLTRALNNGLAVAQGRYVARQDADDVSLPERLERQRDFLEAHAAAVLVGSDGTMVDEQGRDLVTIRNSRKRDLRRHLARSNPFVHGSIMFRRVIGEAPVRYREFYRKAQDYDLILRLAELGEVAILPEVLYRWRFASSGIVASNVTVYGERARENYLRRQRGAPEDLTPPPPELTVPRPSPASLDFALGIRYLSGYRMREARRCFLSGLGKLDRSAPEYRRGLRLLLTSFVPGPVLRYLREV